LALERLQERSKSSDKPEDQMAVIEKRLNNFEKNSSVVVKHFESLKKLARIDCNRPMDSVFRQVCLKIDEQLYYKKIVLPRVLFICGGPGAGKGT
jgi:adenylate kinase family enzyme